MTSPDGLRQPLAHSLLPLWTEAEAELRAHWDHVCVLLEQQAATSNEKVLVDGKAVHLLPIDEKGKIVYQFAHPGFKDVPKWVNEEGYTDVVVMSHGLNNTPTRARLLYRSFLSQLDAQLVEKAAQNLAQNGKENSETTAKKFLYIGLYWPSVVYAETWEQFWKRELKGQDTDPNWRWTRHDPGVPETPVTVNGADLLNEELRRKDGEIQVSVEALEEVDTLFKRATRGVNELVEGGWAAVSTTANIIGNAHVAFTTAIQENGADGIGAFWASHIKGIAGDVGATAGRDIIGKFRETGAKIHLIGHSFGCKLMLEAVRSAGVKADEGVHSLVLIQPAVNRWAFSPATSERSEAGIYAGVPGLVKSPVVVLFSNYDRVLTTIYPVGFGSDPVEHPSVARAAEDYGDAVSMQDYIGAEWKVAALGAHGPDRDCQGAAREPIQKSGHNYKFPEGTRILGVKGMWPHAGIGGWSNANVAWLTASAVCGFQ